MPQPFVASCFSRAGPELCFGVGHLNDKAIERSALAENLRRQTMEKDVQKTFWKEFASSPFIMMKLDGAPGHSEPMTAQLDKDAHHAVWFFAARDNRIAKGGKAMGQVATKGHEVFACISGTLVEETDASLRDEQWNNAVEAWFPNGKTDPNVIMLRFDIEDGEVWTADMGMKQMFKLMTGSKIDPAEAGDHAVGAV